MIQSFLSTFTPSMMSPETLKAIFVQRHKLIDYLIELVEDSSSSKNKHFRLLIGMRGIGKTHTIALLYHRIKEIAELQDKLLIAWLEEDESVASWLKLLLKIFKALEKEYPIEYNRKLRHQIQKISKIPVDNRVQWTENLLQEFIGNKTLLLLTENLDEKFKGLGDLGQKQFRAFLQNHNSTTIIATSQSLFNGVSDKDAAFYGFFTPEYLKKLTIEEATNLLTKIAELQEDKELETFIKSPTGKDRIKAIHHLAGGNHRVYIIFSQFLTRESLDELIPAVMKVLDELTPYYQARMQWLSPQQREIIELLCETRNPIAVKEIAQKSFITHQTASSQLNDLRKKGYVVTIADIPTGRESYYELQEPLMRICLEVKKQRGEPIKLFIDFLRIWYTEEELKFRLETLPQNSIEKKYILYVLRENSEGIRNIKQNEINLNSIKNIFKNNNLVSIEEISEVLDQFILEADNQERHLWYFQVGNELFKLGRYEKAIYYYDQALIIKSTDEAWYNRGLSLFNLGKYSEAINSYQKSIQENDNNYSVWYNLGIVLKKENLAIEAKKAYDRALQINPYFHKAWNNLGSISVDLEDYNGAIIYFRKALELKHNKEITWNNLGYVYDELGEYQQAIKCYEKAIDINPKFHRAFFNKLESLFKLNFWKEGFKDLDKALNRFQDAEDSYKGDTTAYIKIIWESTTDIAVWKSRLQTLVETYNKYKSVSELNKGITNHISTLLSDMVSDKAARSWLEIWQEIAGNKTELTIAIRFLKTAVEYKETKGDRKALLQLATEERSLFEELLAKL